jgi:hypothetical protein
VLSTVTGGSRIHLPKTTVRDQHGAEEEFPDEITDSSSLTRSIPRCSNLNMPRRQP